MWKWCGYGDKEGKLGGVRKVEERCEHGLKEEGKVGSLEDSLGEVIESERGKKE